MNNNTSVTLSLGTLPFNCLFVVGDKQYAKSQFKLQHSKYKTSQLNWANNTGACTYRFPCGDTMVWLPKWSWSLTIHELFHVVVWVLNKIETPLNESTEEVYAYTLQHLIRQLELHEQQ